MKKVLLLIISLFINLCSSAFAYETVLVDFPENQGWQPVSYNQQGNETILQYVPVGQTDQDWTRSVVFHAYKDPGMSGSAARFLDTITAQLESKNSTQSYRYTKYTDADSIATRCIQKNSYIPSQCEILRATKSYEGLISMHYINRNVADFKSSFDLWYQIIKDIRIYYSYYREDRILDKATVFEL